jgi:hypothetical protein
LDPNRCATLFSGEKINRSTYAQTDAPGLRMISNVVGEDLLLWRSHRKKN